MTKNAQNPLRIGIIGGGFSGTALMAMLSKLAVAPIEIVLCEKSGRFGAGPAYSTPFKHHLLNVRAQDMSAFEDEPQHFVNWLRASPEKLLDLDKNQPVAEQFVPRCFYHDYLQDILSGLRSALPGHVALTMKSIDIVDAVTAENAVQLIGSQGDMVTVDKVILAMGNNPPSVFPFPVADDVCRIDNPWDYKAIERIAADDPVLIVGTGLSMIDAVLTLKAQNHKGPIHALSRHGLLPLPHGEILPAEAFSAATVMAQARDGMRAFTRILRGAACSHMQKGGDWRTIVGGLRSHIPHVWRAAPLAEKKRFLRHLLPYWNVHRHRVHTDIMDLLSSLVSAGQLMIHAGRVLSVAKDKATIQLRHSTQQHDLAVRWVVNCMGPAPQMRASHQPLLAAMLKREIATLDELKLGLAVSAIGSLRDVSGRDSSRFYSVGALTRGESWEINAVPDIRRQIFDLSRHILASE